MAPAPDSGPEVGAYALRDGTYAELDHYGLVVRPDRSARFESACGYAEIASTPVVNGALQWGLDWYSTEESASSPHRLLLEGRLVDGSMPHDTIIATITSEEGRQSTLSLVYGAVYTQPRCH